MSRALRNAAKRLGLNQPKEIVEETRYMRDGVVISPEELRYQIYTIAQENLENADVALESFDRTLRTIEDINELISVENRSLLSPEIIETLTLSRNRLLSETEAEAKAISLEGYSTSMENAFANVLKSIWKAITGFIVGFFKAIMNFFKALFGVAEDTEDEKKKNEKELEKLEVSDEVTEEKPITVKSKLPIFLKVTATNDVIDLQSAVINAYMNYQRVNADVYNVLIDKPLIDIIPKFKEALKDIPTKMDNRAELDKYCIKLINLFASIQNTFNGLPHTIKNHSSLNSTVIDGLNIDNGIDAELTVKSLIDSNDINARLSRNFNVFAYFNNSSEIHTRYMNTLLEDDFSSMIFKCAQYEDEVEKDDYDLISPVSDAGFLESVTNLAIETSTRLNIKAVRNQITSIQGGIDTILKSINNKALIDISKLKDSQNKGDFDLRKALLESIAEFYKTDAWVTFTDKKHFKRSLTRIALSGGDSERSMEKAVEEMPSIDVMLEWFEGHENELEGTLLLATIALIRNRNIDDEILEKYHNFDKVINNSFKNSLNTVKDLVKCGASDYFKNYIEFDKEVTDYITASRKALEKKSK